jgi:ankyrin repeat protein
VLSRNTVGAQSLLKNGANVNSLLGDESSFNLTPLMVAVIRGYKDQVETLLQQHSVNIYPREFQNFGLTLAHYMACKHPGGETLTLLLKKDPNVVHARDST